MLSIGILELVIVSLISLVSLAIPTTTLVIAVLIYRKLERLEHALTEQG
jgi:hypothetical protein